MARDITTRRRARAILARIGAPCFECGQPIDYRAPAKIDGAWNPEAFEADHIVPLSRGGLDAVENMHALHARCNRAKGNRKHAGVLRTSGVLG